MPAGVVSVDILESLRDPTLNSLLAAGDALLKAGQLDLAETVFNSLKNRPECEPQATVALARIASGRRDSAAAVSAWQDCLRRFPDCAQPYWHVELARAHGQLGCYADAEAVLRNCAELYPRAPDGAVHLADFLSQRGRFAEAAAQWQSAIREFPERIEAWWLMSLASVLRAGGDNEQYGKVLEEMVRRFPDAEATLIEQAENAARREDWLHALEFFSKCLERYPDAVYPSWLNGRAKALFYLGRPEEAFTAWQDLLKRFPDFIYAYTDQATAAEWLGLWEDANALWASATERFHGQLRPEWMAQRAHCLLYPQPDQAVRLAIAELERLFPDSPLGPKAAIELAERMSCGQKEIAPLLADALRRFPEDRLLLAQQVRILLASGRLDEADRITQRLKEYQDDYLAVIARWSVDAQRDGLAAIQDSAREVASKASWAVWPGLAIANHLFSLYAVWATERALELYDDLARRFPAYPSVSIGRTYALIVLGNLQKALELIDSAPAMCRDQRMLELRAWACAQRGDEHGERRIWKSIVERYYFPAIHSPKPNLDLLTPERLNLPPGEVSVFVMVRDEASHLPEFLRHYRKLGVGRFVAVENLSSDGTVDYLRAQQDVLLYRTADNRQTAGSGMRWMNELMARHGGGGWCLYADADEALIYPGWESTPLRDFLAYLEREGAEAVAAFMLDLYPERLFHAAGAPAAYADACYYDRNYTWVGHVRPPYRRPTGGVRPRLFSTEEYLQKVPLIRSGRGVYLNAHEITPLRFSAVTGILLHYKLLGLADELGSGRQKDCIIDVTRRNNRYLTLLKTLQGADLRLPGISEPLADSLVMADSGLIRAPREFRDWLHHRRSSL
jgi:tetratricopeptide (TPR) repeat protein